MFNFLILAALSLAALRAIEQSLNRGAVQQRIAQVVNQPISTDRAFILRIATRSHVREVEQAQMVYPGAWGDMAQTIADDINMDFNN